MNERGAVAVVLVAVAGVLVVMVAVVADVGSIVAARRAAMGAADAAALAAAPVTFRPFGAAGSAAAEAARFATANGAALVSCRCPQDPSWAARIVEVEVDRPVHLVIFGDRTVSATSRARFDPGALARGSPPGPAAP